MHPNGAAGKKFIREVTRLLNSWYENSALARISMKAVHIMPALLLQKPSSSSKSKECSSTGETNGDVAQRSN